MSTNVQLKGDSLRRQLEASNTYADEHGLVIDDTFKLEDIGVSAFKGDNISFGALGRFLEAVRVGEIVTGSTLLIESLDRLSRQQVMSSLAIFTNILQSGINIITLSNRHIYNAGETDFQQLIYSIVVMSRAHEESEQKSYRLKSAWANKRRNTEIKLTSKCPGWLQLDDDRRRFNVIDDTCHPSALPNEDTPRSLSLRVIA